MKAQTFQIGDIVQLRSGGPRMTVTAMQEGNHAVCAWFAGATMSTGSFPSAILTHADLIGTVKGVQNAWREWLMPQRVPLRNAAHGDQRN